jgi:hypothetical protein
MNFNKLKNKYPEPVEQIERFVELFSSDTEKRFLRGMTIVAGKITAKHTRLRPVVQKDFTDPADYLYRHSVKSNQLVR